MRRNLPWLFLAVVGGGACGGSTGSGGSTDPETLIQNACDTITGMHCPNGITPAECDTELHKERADSVANGCGPTYDALISCVANKASSCDQLGKQICGPEVDAVAQCNQPAPGQECSASFGGAPPGAPPGYQQCDVGCPDWGAHCVTDASSTLVCTCEQGPHAGTTFQPGDCSAVSPSSGAQYCG
jgi:hypothetical protein